MSMRLARSMAKCDPTPLASLAAPPPNPPNPFPLWEGVGGFGLCSTRSLTVAAHQDPNAERPTTQAESSGVRRLRRLTQKLPISIGGTLNGSGFGSVARIFLMLSRGSFPSPRRSGITFEPPLGGALTGRSPGEKPYDSKSDVPSISATDAASVNRARAVLSRWTGTALLRGASTLRTATSSEGTFVTVAPGCGAFG